MADLESYKDSTFLSYAGRERPTPDGGRELYCLAHAALTAKQAYKVTYGSKGPVTMAIVDDALLARIIIPEVAVASGAYFWGKIRGFVKAAVGLVSDTYIQNEGLLLYNGTIAGTNSAFGSLATEFAYVITPLAVAGTATDIYLLGREATATT